MKLNLKQWKNNRGITLIALVVTIVVLLILAGVSINALFGNSGIIVKAKEAQNKMNQAVENDQKGINELSNWIDNNINNSDKNGSSEFTIGTKKYKMEGNMTWKDWVGSSYNVDKYKIEDKIEELKLVIEEKKVIKFSSISDKCTCKLEIVVTFLALLELIKDSFVKVLQYDNLGEIIIEKDW